MYAVTALLWSKIPVCPFKSRIVSLVLGQKSLILAFPQATRLQIPACFTFSATTILGCRLVLNLCGAYHHPFAAHDSAWSTDARLPTRCGPVEVHARPITETEEGNSGT